MNEPKRCHSKLNNDKWDERKKKYRNDNAFLDMGCYADGTHVLTGEGADVQGDHKQWTCVALEVYWLRDAEIVIPQDY